MSALLALLPVPIVNEFGARRFLDAVAIDADGWHPEESAANLVSRATGAPVFSPDTASLADLRMNEVHCYIGDPCAYLLDCYARLGVL